MLRRNPPRTRAYGYLPAGVYTGQEYARQLIEKPNTFYYGVLWNKLYRRDLLAGHGIRFRQELFAEDQLFNTEYLRYVRTAVSIPDIGYYYLQCSQSVSHSRVTTADILLLRRRVMGLYKSIYTELGIYPARTSSPCRRWTPRRPIPAGCNRLFPRAKRRTAFLKTTHPDCRCTASGCFCFYPAQQPMEAHFSASQTRSSAFRCGASFANT